jgi:cytochrome c553
LRIAALLFFGALAGPALSQDDAAARKLAEPCFACHGPEGSSTNPLWPILAGQSWRYIYIQLKDFKEGRRADPLMTPMAAALSREDMIALGNYFAAQKPRSIDFKVDAAKAEAGKKISDVVLCPMCHQGEFKGQNEIPRVAGQWPQYVTKQLQDFRARKRTNDGGNMTSVSSTLTDADIENLAHYIANLD